MPHKYFKMKRLQLKHLFIGICLCFVIISFNIVSSSAQSLENTYPPTYHSSLIFSDIAAVNIARPSEDYISQAKANSNKGELYVIARLMETHITTDTEGQWETLENGDHVWRVKIVGKHAKALALHFDRFNLPRGSRLYVYDEDRTQLLGGYNEKDSNGDKEYSIGLILGESVIVEYVAPSMFSKGEKKAILNEEVATPDFVISKVAYIFRGVEDLQMIKDLGDCESCEVNVNCPEGDNWQLQIVVLLVSM